MEASLAPMCFLFVCNCARTAPRLRRSGIKRCVHGVESQTCLAFPNQVFYLVNAVHKERLDNVDNRVTNDLKLMTEVRLFFRLPPAFSIVLRCLRTCPRFQLLSLMFRSFGCG